MGFTAFACSQSEAAQKLCDKLYKGKPEQLQDFWGHPLYWAALEFWKQAIEKAGTLDQKVIRDIMATQKFNTMLGPTWFEKGLMAKECHTGEIGQWQNGVFEVVGPKKHATAEFVYPKSEWPPPPEE